jgi:MFS family permease
MRTIWISQVLSEFGDWAARVALAILVERRTGSAALTALVATVSLLPYIGVGWLVSGIADRLPRRSVMVGTDLARAAIFAVLILPLPVWAILALVFVASCFTPPFEAARAALLPNTVPRERYGDAIALSQVTFEIMLLVGYLGGGGLSALLSPEGALAVNAATFVLSALVLVRLREGRVPAADDASERPGVRAGLRAVFGDPFVRRFATGYTIAGACAFVGEALAAAYAREELVGGFAAPEVDTATAAYAGFLSAAVPAGVVIAAFLLPKAKDDTGSMRIAAVAATVGSVAALVGFLLGPSFPAALLPYLCLGIVFASRIPANQVSGLRIPDSVRASAFGILAGLMLAGQGGAALLGGLLGDEIGVRTAIVAFLALGAAVSLYGVVSPPREPAGSHADVSSPDWSSTAIPSGSRGSENR